MGSPALRQCCSDVKLYLTHKSKKWHCMNSRLQSCTVSRINMYMWYKHTKNYSNAIKWSLLGHVFQDKHAVSSWCGAECWYGIVRKSLKGREETISETEGQNGQLDVFGYAAFIRYLVKAGRAENILWFVRHKWRIKNKRTDLLSTTLFYIRDYNIQQPSVLVVDMD